MEFWTPTPFDLTKGPPFAGTPYPHSLSTKSNTEAFTTGIDNRDRGRCIICKTTLAIERACIVPPGESKTWKRLKRLKIIPAGAKSAEHEPRNGVLMCANHRNTFDRFFFNIRWIPSVQKFVFVNQSQHPALEKFHGKTVDLDPSNSRVPFSGAFVVHEMRSRGFWPWLGDRPIDISRLVPTAEDKDEEEEAEGEDAGDADEDAQDDSDNVLYVLPPKKKRKRDDRIPAHASSSLDAADAAQPTMLTLTNIFEDPTALREFQESLPQQASWKACVIENASWDGTAEENIEQYQSLMNP
ncbi:hypothetical protein C8R44DRAFT_67747 [Mycena epipterygia]|nr:hypothetical protein C8R44DRAFT_67747 [Mycena epipterygia]